MLRFLSLFLILLTLIGCSKNSNQIYIPSEKIDPYKIYNEGLNAMEDNDYFFANKKAAHALKWYGKVDTDALSKNNRKELNFKMGYGLLVSKNLALAKIRFLPLINVSTIFRDFSGRRIFLSGSRSLE